MKRGVVVVLGFLLCSAVSACERGNPAPAPTIPSISVSYVDGAPPGVAVAATHPHPLLSAELVAPGGAAISTASAVERDSAGPGTVGSPVGVGVGVFGGSGGGIGTGIGLGFPLGSGPPPPPANPNRYRARIPISDLAAYRQSWERTTVRLRFGTPSDNVTAEIPAPAPRAP